MGKRFRTDHLDQGLLLPPSLHDWLPEGHLARFIADVVEELDLTAVYQSYEGDGRGLAAYQPSMMIRLLVYGYCLGVVSSRKIERATHEDVAFRFLSADTHPDHDTIATFRKRHLEALAGLFVQVLQLCGKAGLVKLGHVAIDGTKIKANASKHKAMSYDRMDETEQRLRQEVEELLRRAAEADEAEDAQYGKGKRGDELPAELARRESRLKKIREAKAALEQEAKEKAERQRAEAEARIAERREQEARTGKKIGGHDPKVPDPEQAKPEAKAQRNFTDPDSRIMVDGANKGSFIQAYNAQAAVDSQTQVVVAAEVTQEANDSQQLVPMIEQVEANMGRKPEAVSADAGYWSEDNVSDEHVAGIDLYIATGRQKHGEKAELAKGPPPEDASAKQVMAQKLRTEAGHSIYKMRKAIVEPVFGQTKEGRGFCRFSFRGVGNVRLEWTLVCLTGNLLKLFRSGWSPQTA
ncbi:MAG: IS1182 family transposase [Acidobacteria bacterium]|nr:IS1182 family transposase [Acidobacteriota bacterium]